MNEKELLQVYTNRPERVVLTYNFEVREIRFEEWIDPRDPIYKDDQDFQFDFVVFYSQEKTFFIQCRDYLKEDYIKKKFDEYLTAAGANTEHFHTSNYAVCEWLEFCRYTESGYFDPKGIFHEYK